MSNTKVKEQKSSWKSKNKKVLQEKILNNELEIERINKYLDSFFTTDDETRAMRSNISSLEAKNKKLRNLEPSDLSPEHIIKLTSSQLPPADGYLKKHHNNTLAIPFIDETVATEARERKAMWKLVLNEWQYQGYE